MYSVQYIYENIFSVKTEELNVASKGLDMALFSHVFGKNYLMKLIDNTIFFKVSNRLALLHKKCYQKQLKILKYENINLKAPQKLIFMGFHSLGNEEAMFKLFKRYNYERIGVVGENKEMILRIFESSYKQEVIKVNEYEFIYDGIRFIMCPVNDGIANYTRITGLIKRNIPLLLQYDFFTHSDIRTLFDENQNIKKPEKYFIYEFNGRRLLLMSTYIFYLLRRTGATAIPIYNQRGRFGQDTLVTGNMISTPSSASWSSYRENKLNDFFNFMMENIQYASQGWNKTIISKQISHLWKTNIPINNSSVDGELILQSNIFISRLKDNQFFLTNSYPLLFMKIDKKLYPIVADIKKHKKVTNRTKMLVSKEKLTMFMKRLIETGVLKPGGG